MMKNKVFYQVVCLFLFLGANAQNLTRYNNLSEDEKARVKFSVHLINYQLPPVFDNAIGESYYNLVKFNFMENFSILRFSPEGITVGDQATVDSYIDLLEGAAKNPLSWNQLLKLETQYLNWWDRANHKVSRYKN